MLPSTPYSSSNPYPEGEARPENDGNLQGTYQWESLDEKGAFTVETWEKDGDDYVVSEGSLYGNPNPDAGKISKQAHGNGMIQASFVNGILSFYFKLQMYYDLLRDKNLQQWLESGGNLLATDDDNYMAGTSGEHPDAFDPTDSANHSTLEVTLKSPTNSTGITVAPINIDTDDTFDMGDITFAKFTSVALQNAAAIRTLIATGDTRIVPVLATDPDYFLTGPYEHGWQAIDIYGSPKVKELQRQLALQAAQLAGIQAQIGQSLAVKSDELQDPTTSNLDSYNLTEKRFLNTGFGNIPFAPGEYERKTFNYDGDDSAIAASESDRAVFNFAQSGTNARLFGFIHEKSSHENGELGSGDLNPFGGMIDYIVLDVAQGGASAFLNVGMKRGGYDHLENQNAVPGGGGVSLTTDGILFMVLANIGADSSDSGSPIGDSHEFEIDRYSTYHRDGIEWQLARAHLPTREAVAAFLQLLASDNTGRFSARWKTYRGNSHPLIGFATLRNHASSLQNTFYDSVISDEDILKDKINELTDAINTLNDVDRGTYADIDKL